MDRVPDPPGYPDPEPEPPNPGKRIDIPNPPPGEGYPDPEQVPKKPREEFPPKQSDSIAPEQIGVEK